MNNNLFLKNKYCVVKNAIGQEVCELVTQYALFDEMSDFTPDKFQVPSAHSKYSDPLMESILLKILPIVEKNTMLELYPTYSFYRVYRSGDELKRHVDRYSCEISVTACFNFKYDSDSYRWPIFIDGNEINLNPGDIAIYKGIELNHWREAMDQPEDSWLVQAFFHYVDKNGKYSEYKFDKRNSLGLKKNNGYKSYISRTV